VAYRHEIADEDTAPDERAERFLGMLTNLLRRHGRDTWGVYDKRLEGRQSLKRETLARVLSELESMGVVTIDASMIVLNEPWVDARFDGKGRPGLRSLDDHRKDLAAGPRPDHGGDHEVARPAAAALTEHRSSGEPVSPPRVL
jgi:hypothetical protein